MYSCRRRRRRWCEARRCVCSSGSPTRDRHRRSSVNVRARMRVTWRHDDVVVCAARSVGADGALDRSRPRPGRTSAAADVDPRQSRHQTRTPRATTSARGGRHAAELVRAAGDVHGRASPPLPVFTVCWAGWRRGSSVWREQKEGDVVANGRELANDWCGWWLRPRCAAIRTSC